jgi:L-ascorbate metabolism protein UlaG (beta-lactamase superfamily)
MKIKYIGHACFLIETKDGVRILTDPYEPGAFGALKYSKIEDEADIVTVSHEHADHNAVSSVPGKPEVVKGAGKHTVKGINFYGIQVYHDRSGGRERGDNVLFIIESDLRILHCGDLGHTLDEKHIEEIGKVDILLIPVGGYFTIGPIEATKIMQKISPKVTIPMHYKTPKVDFPIKPVEEFLKDKGNVKRMGSSITVELPEEMEIWVLEPSN